jgi:hypothetical protein
MVYTLRFLSLQNAVYFIILTYLVPELFTFYIQAVPKFKKKNNSGTKRLKQYREIIAVIFEARFSWILTSIYIFRF